MKVLVTGSAGFVGKHAVAAFTARGHKVFGADKRTGMDLSDLYVAELAMGWQPEVIVHLAGSCSTPGSLTAPLSTFDDTVVAAVNVIAAAGKTPIVLTSSVKARDGRTPYGAAKRMVETWAQEWRQAYEVPIIINRPGTIYGPGQEGSPESGWIAWFCKAKAEGRTVTINGDGEQIRDLLHVSDYVKLLLIQAENIERYDTGALYDVGGGPNNMVSVIEMAKHLGLQYQFGPPRYGDSDIYVGLNDVPGWKPVVRWQMSDTLR